MGLTDKLLVNLNDIEERISQIDINISPKQLKYNVLTCQDMFTRQILGDKLYFDLLDEFNPQTGVMNPPYETLYEYVIQHLTARVVERSVFNIHFRLTNKGVQTQNSDYSNASTDTNVFRYQNVIKRDAEFYETRLWNFLKENKADFPLWQEKSDDINPQQPESDFGIFII